MSKLQNALGSARPDNRGILVMLAKILTIICEHDGDISASSDGGCLGGSNPFGTNSPSCDGTQRGWSTIGGERQAHKRGRVFRRPQQLLQFTRVRDRTALESFAFA